jgi:CubicO group peptidase (beta-lactamase class C family)
MFSISKSFTSIAIGLLADEGRLSLEDPVIKYFPEKLPDKDSIHPWVAQMTIKDMLMMRTCHASTTYKLDMSSDWVASFLPHSRRIHPEQSFIMTHPQHIHSAHWQKS